MTPVLTHERGQKWVPELASPFRADTNLQSDSAPCLPGEWGQPTQTELGRSWKQCNIFWRHTSLYSITFSQCNLSIFFLSKWDRVIRIQKTAYWVKGVAHLACEWWKVLVRHLQTWVLSAVHFSLVSLLLLQCPQKIAYGMSEGTSFPVVWKTSYTTCYTNKFHNFVTHHAFHF